MQIGRFIQIWFLFLVCTLLIIIPIINIRQYPFSPITSKFVVFMYAILLIGCAYIFKILTNRANLIQFSISKLDISLFFGLIFIIANRYLIQDDYNFSIRFFELLGLSVLYLMIREVQPKNYIYILLVIIIAGVMQAIYGGLQYLGVYHSNHALFEITGSFFNPGPYAGFIGLTGTLGFGLYLFKQQIIISLNSNHKFLNICNHIVFRYIPILSVISTLFILPLTGSRAAYLSFFIGGMLLFELKYYVIRKHFAKNKKLIGFFLTAGTLVLIFGLYYLKPASADGRILIWKISTSMLADNLFFGVGFDNFTTHYMNYQANYFAFYKDSLEIMVADDAYYAFNEFLQFFVENGLLGMTLLITIIIIVFNSKASEQYKPLMLIVHVSFIALMIFACFSYPAQILPIKLVGVVLIGMLSNLDVRTNKMVTVFKSGSSIHAVNSFLILMMSVALFWGTKRINLINNGFLKWETIAKAGIFQDYNMNAEEYGTLLPIFKKNGLFLFVYGRTLLRAEHYSEALVILLEAEKYQNDSKVQVSLAETYKSLRLYEKAEQSYKKTANMVPAKINPQYQLVKLYVEMRQTEKAVAIAKKILERDLKIDSDEASAIQNEMRLFIESFEK